MAVVLKDILALDCGAQFLNVDVHIHTFGGSKDVKDAGMTPQAIIESAVAQGLSVIAITDHNSNKSIDAALTHAQKYVDRLLVLPGVEVTTANGHLLAYFAPERAGELSRFLAKLDLIGEMGDDNTHTAKSMADVIAEADKLGGICVAAHIDRAKTGFETLASGYPNWKRDILTSAGLYGLECDAAASLSWYSDMEEPGSAGAERTKLLQARRAVPTLQGRRHLAHMQGSDAHSLIQFQTQSPDKPWTRIKMTELSFGALRTALIDPTARVVAKIAVPRSVPRVRGMAVTGGFIDGEIIRFSDNLNCFIGGRGTGKSTAIRSLAYCFGIDEAFGEFESCPDTVVVYCEDADGVVYRYERTKGSETTVKAREDGAITEVPVDAFRIEYFGQGELARVAEDPLNNPGLFQSFLDRHISLGDLAALEESLVRRLRTNAAQLDPLEGSFAQLDDKRKALADIEKKLKVAEEGKLREIVGIQSRIASEKAVRAELESIVVEYNTGLSLSVLERDFDKIVATAGELTGDEASDATMKAMRTILDAANTSLSTKEKEINALLKGHATGLQAKCVELKAHHARMESALATKIAELKAKGLAGNLAELEQLLKQKASLAREISAIEQRGKELLRCRNDRQGLLAQLKTARADMTRRRKDQLQSINANLGRTITDYRVFVKYDDAGIV
ncbi:MAG: TrlF family ATPase, partial [Phycisphaerales bacterium]